MNLWDLIARADARALAASGLACLDRCLPPAPEGEGPEPLRPLWASCEDGTAWAARLTAARGTVAALDEPAGAGEAPGEPLARIRAVLDAAPETFEAGPLRAWADACSLLSLEIHRRADQPPAPEAGAPATDAAGPWEAPEGGEREALELLRIGSAGAEADAGPLVSGELRRQRELLEILAETAGSPGSGAGLRRALDHSTEGRRVLRAVMSRRARHQA
ncbi:hypothetical protein [Streptomyces sp. NBC_00102]|uniref:hypothetical protein n=1 Tax=Streptomyces sp. NBC_00102 TaxID=2975652 RepID=UPI00224DEBEA|nr:hypothetical protein [Streptomyces sp. NBC_00102]MCX5399289.1 hypothetical protein [Streptomyces sp. NBC_00102]